ncbi:MAG: segregation/condensation protein A [Coriobacteriia bacterium]|nr:segregation/condensation protein A [Coriobacteriia bacterium]
MSYRVKIESFEGPFQLLLALVSEQKVDIGAVSVTEVADQYLAYLDTMHDLDMDVASDFLVVASTLLAIKASSLLPSDNPVDYDEEFEDFSPSEARDILIARLIAYKQFKNVAASFGSRLESESRMHARQAGLEASFVGLLPDYLEGVTLRGLAVICADLAARRKTFLLDAAHITARPIPVEERLEVMARRLAAHRKMTFAQLIENSTDPMQIVVSFLAVLEMYHQGMIDLEQTEHQGVIDIVYRDKDDWAPAPDVEEPDDVVVEYLETLVDDEDSEQDDMAHNVAEQDDEAEDDDEADEAEDDDADEADEAEDDDAEQDDDAELDDIAHNEEHLSDLDASDAFDALNTLYEADEISAPDEPVELDAAFAPDESFEFDESHEFDEPYEAEEPELRGRKAKRARKKRGRIL